MAANDNYAWVKDNPSPYQQRDLTHFPDWGALTVWDAFFNNLTAGLMIVAAIAWGAGAPVFSFMLPFAMITALVLVLVDVGFLISDLADPWRFLHSLRVMRFTSPLSVGVWGLSCYSIFVALGAICWCLGLFAGGGNSFVFIMLILAKLFTVLATIGAVVVICYKGVVFSCSSQPGLKNARWLTSFMVSDSLLMGLALYIILTIICAPRGAAVNLLIPFITLVFARCITFALLWQDVKYRAGFVYSKRHNKIVHCSIIGGGGILAIAISLCGMPGLVISAILVLCAGIVERYWIIGLPRPVS